MSFSLDPFLFDHGFCESRVFNGHPEYMNILSSLFMTYIGIQESIRLYHKVKYNLILFNASRNANNLLICLAVNGLTSALYHTYGNIGTGVLDRASMILIMISSYYYLNVLNVAFLLHILIAITSLALHIEDLFNLVFLIYLIVIYGLTYKYSRGAGLLILSVSAWAVTELFFCNIFTCFFHAIWHICCSISIKLIISDTMNKKNCISSNTYNKSDHNV